VTAALTESVSTVERLLDAAERLIADRGVEAVSLRAVNAAAGTNVAAVHYHFGSKDALIDAVLRRRMEPLARRRLAMLAALEDRDPLTVRAVAETLVVPLAEMSADATGPGRVYVRFLAALQDGGPTSRALLGAAFAPQLGPFDAALARALPGVPTPVRRFRLGIVGGVVVRTLADAERAASTLTADAGDSTGVIDALVDVVAGALDAPIGGSRSA
jgi:AcrR family transcriptional regulator